MEEVEKHDSKESAWFVVDGRVYDATPFLKEHPGGWWCGWVGWGAGGSFNARFGGKVHACPASLVVRQPFGPLLLCVLVRGPTSYPFWADVKWLLLPVNHPPPTPPTHSPRRRR